MGLSASNSAAKEWCARACCASRKEPSRANRVVSCFFMVCSPGSVEREFEAAALAAVPVGADVLAIGPGTEVAECAGQFERTFRGLCLDGQGPGGRVELHALHVDAAAAGVHGTRQFAVPGIDQQTHAGVALFTNQVARPGPFCRMAGLCHGRGKQAETGSQQHYSRQQSYEHWVLL